MEAKEAPWGVSTCIDLCDCNLSRMQDEMVLRRFVRELCDLIGMRRYGETQVVRFGDDPRVAGYSSTQLIETPLISTHLAGSSKAVYLDVFSCAPYDPDGTAAFASRYFGARSCAVPVVRRR